MRRRRTPTSWRSTTAPPPDASTSPTTCSSRGPATPLPPAIAGRCAEAPGVSLRIGHLGPESRSSDRVLLDNDALIAPLGFGFPGISRPLWRDRMVVVADRTNPRLVDGRLTMTDLAELPHAVGSFGPGVLTPVDRVFGEHDIERHVALQVFGFLPLPFVIEGTDMVAVVPEMLARIHLRPRGAVVQVDPPFGEVLLPEGYWFAQDRLSDPAHRWLFSRLDAVRDQLASTAAS